MYFPYLEENGNDTEYTGKVPIHSVLVNNVNSSTYTSYIPRIYLQEHFIFICTNVCVCVFFSLTDQASTIPSNISGCQSGT